MLTAHRRAGAKSNPAGRRSPELDVREGVGRFDRRDEQIDAPRHHHAAGLQEPAARIGSVLEDSRLEAESPDLIADDGIDALGQDDLGGHPMDANEPIAISVGRRSGPGDFNHTRDFDRVDARSASLTGHQSENAAAARKVEHHGTRRDDLANRLPERGDSGAVRQVLPVLVDDQRHRGITGTSTC